MNIEPEQFTEDAHIKTYPLSSLILKMKNKQLNVKPSYQRGNVWEAAEKTKLIQSILGGIQLPALIFSKSGNNGFIAIDGKQRLTAMKEFFDNKIKFYNESDPDKFCYYKDLHKDWQSKFNDSQISVYLYVNLKEEEQREIFERINYGKILSYGEKIKGLNSDIIPELTKIVSNISPYLQIFGVNNKRSSYYECVGALLALFNKSYINVSKGRSCLEYIKKISRENDNNITQKGILITKVLKKLSEIYNNFSKYCQKRKYKKIKWKWTDILVYTYLLHKNYDIKIVEKVSKYIKHRQEECEYITDNCIQFIAYNDKFGQRSNTNSSNFFIDRENLINNLYKWIIKKPNSEIRNQVYAKCGTTGESVCKFCNNHKIYLTNFQLGHIISKNNGGSMEVSNLFPICATCNNSMNKTDMDLYITKNKMNINLT